MSERRGGRPMVDNAGDGSQIRAAKQKEKLRRDRELDDLRALLAHPAGRRVIWRLLTEARVFRTAFDPDPTTLAFNTGKKEQGLFLLDELEKANPTAFLSLMQDASTEEKQRNG